MCEFLGDDKYTIAEGQEGDESPDSTSATDAAADADSTQTDSATEAEADSTPADYDCPLCEFLDDDRYAPAEAFFAAANLERVVRQTLRQPHGRLTPEDVALLTAIQADEKNIQSLVGLEHCTALEFLSLMGNQIADVRPLANMTNLTWLSLVNNQIVDVAPLTNMTDLYSLQLMDNQIADVGPLLNLTNLQNLSLYNNPLSTQSRTEHIPALKARGVGVRY